MPGEPRSSIEIRSSPRTSTGCAGRHHRWQVRAADPGRGRTGPRRSGGGGSRAIRVRLCSKPARRPVAVGWKITDARCHPGFGYGMDGWKQFDRSVALLSMSWMDYPGEDRDRIYIKARTPPVSAGSPTNAPPLPSREVDLATTCLAQADGDENDASPRRSTVPAELLRLRRDRGGADR
jgi:hypothetical protein